MKKMLTLLFALGAITTAFAQYDHRDHREVVVGRPVYNDDRRFIFSARERDEQIRQINWRFDNQIADVARDRFLRGGERRRQIRFLEEQRREQIRLVNLRFEQGSRFHDRVYRDGRY